MAIDSVSSLHPMYSVVPARRRVDEGRQCRQLTQVDESSRAGFARRRHTGTRRVTRPPYRSSCGGGACWRWRRQDANCGRGRNSLIDRRDLAANCTAADANPDRNQGAEFSFCPLYRLLCSRYAAVPMDHRPQPKNVEDRNGTRKFHAKDPLRLIGTARMLCHLYHFCLSK